MATPPPEAAAAATDGLDPARPDGTIARFDLNTRLLHWANALAFGVLAVTGAVMFFPTLSEAVGRREVVRVAHDVAGYVTVLWALVAIAGTWGRGLRDDLRTIDLRDAADRAWSAGGWRADLLGGPDADIPPVGKYNPGQKLNAAFTAAAMAVLAGTGTIMFFHTHFPQWLKAGANLVHDLTALVLVLVVAAHVGLGLRDRGALRGIVTGRVRPEWAERHHRGWARVTSPGPDPDRPDQGDPDSPR